MYGLAVVGLVIAAAVLIAQAETCKFPPYELVEKFSYRIDLTQTSTQDLSNPGCELGRRSSLWA